MNYMTLPVNKWIKNKLYLVSGFEGNKYWHMNSIKKGEYLPQIDKGCSAFIFKIIDGEYVQLRSVEDIPAGTFEVVDTDIDKVIYKDKIMGSSSIVHNEYSRR